MENIFESRYRCVNELVKMGAKIKINDREAIIKGVRKLHSKVITSSDLRGGAALVVAALIAKGKTEVKDISYILRGYENIDEKLRKNWCKNKLLKKVIKCQKIIRRIIKIQRKIIG